MRGVGWGLTRKMVEHFTLCVSDSSICTFLQYIANNSENKQTGLNRTCTLCRRCSFDTKANGI